MGPGDDSCSSDASLFYGLYVLLAASLIRPIEAFHALHRQLAVLDILANHRRSGSQASDTESAVSRIPEEIWREIKVYIDCSRAQTFGRESEG